MKNQRGVAGSAMLLALILGVTAARADDYARQPGIDAEHYVYRLELSDTTETIHGEATARIKFLLAGQTRFALDLAAPAMVNVGGRGRGLQLGGARGRGQRRGAAGDAATSAGQATGGGLARGRGRGANGGTTPTLALRGMSVESVASGGKPARYEHRAGRLWIEMESAPAAGETREFTIKYHGIAASGLRIGPNRYDERSFFSTNWPDLAHQWIPIIDHPSDKATSEFIITAPAKYQAIANGLLVEDKDQGGGRRLTHWKQSVPIASWLNAIGVENFAVHRGETIGGIEISSWVAAQDAEAGPIYFEGPAKQALEFYREAVGPYPYEKLANVSCPGLGGGTEHASEIFYGESGVRAQPATLLVAHEVAHQWFGCSVTESDWDDVWLSEGFATYFTLLFTEHYDGRAAFERGLASSRNRVFQTEAGLPGEAVIHKDMVGTRGVLNQLVYQKGGWVLHMLRAQVGTQNFWKGMRAYYQEYRDKNATTADLQRVMEQASGQKLDWFFDQWLRRAGSPTVEATWVYDSRGKQIEIDLAQTQAGDVYHLPLEIGVSDDGTTRTMRTMQIDMTQKALRVTIPAPSAPRSVILDPNVWMLAHMTVKSGGDITK